MFFLLLATFVAPTHAEDRPERDPLVMKLSSDQQVAFVRSTAGITGRVPGGATLHLDADLDPLRRAALVRELAEAGALVVEREVLSKGHATGVDAEAEELAERVHALDRSFVDVAVPDALRRWSPPTSLVQLEIYRDADPATARQFRADESEGRLACVGLRTIDGARGTLRGQQIACGESTSEAVEVLQLALAEQAIDEGLCRGSARVLQLPTLVRADQPSWLATDTPLYRDLNQALAEGGCAVLDLPPGGGVDGTWSYDAPRFDRIGPSRVEGWRAADYVLQVRTGLHTEPAGELLADLEEQLDWPLIDPDLVRKDPLAEVKVRDVELEVVQLSTGRIVHTSHLDLGTALAGDVLATAVTDLTLGRKPTAWVEVHPIPSSGTVKIGRAETTGTGVVALRPGKHRADLFLVEGGKVEATERFAIGGHAYGVLPVTTPFGGLEVTTTPPGVEVIVDGVSWGPSPVTKTIGGGSHEVRAVREGCGEDAETVEVLVGETTGVLLNLPGVVVAKVEPAEADIAIEGEPVGQGEGSLRVPYGLATVRFSLPGYEDAERSVAVESCVDNPVSFSFEGKIAADSAPGGALVRIDAEDIGPGPIEEIVGIGPHTVSCHWCEWGNGSAEVEVRPGRTTELTVPIDPEGFRFGVGATVGFLAQPQGQTSPELGLLLEGWSKSRFGAVATVGLRPGNTGHYALGPAVRLMGPAPQTSLVLSPQLHALRFGGLAGGATADLHVCFAQLAVFRVGLSAAYGPTPGPLIGLNVGLTRRTGTPWRD